MVPMSDVTDELDDSPMLEEVLGDALGFVFSMRNLPKKANLAV